MLVLVFFLWQLMLLTLLVFLLSFSCVFSLCILSPSLWHAIQKKKYDNFYINRLPLGNPQGMIIQMMYEILVTPILILLIHTLKLLRKLESYHKQGVCCIQKHPKRLILDITLTSPGKHIIFYSLLNVNTEIHCNCLISITRAQINTIQ